MENSQHLKEENEELKKISDVNKRRIEEMEKEKRSMMARLTEKDELIKKLSEEYKTITRSFFI